MAPKLAVKVDLAAVSVIGMVNRKFGKTSQRTPKLPAVLGIVVIGFRIQIPSGAGVIMLIGKAGMLKATDATSIFKRSHLIIKSVFEIWRLVESTVAHGLIKQPIAGAKTTRVNMDAAIPFLSDTCL